jgi:hypothetical protein
MFARCQRMYVVRRMCQVTTGTKKARILWNKLFLNSSINQYYLISDLDPGFR